MTASLDISALARGYASGALAPADVVKEVYGRIEAGGERPIWISLVPLAEALAKAQAAPKGPLHGIPFAVKDNIDIAGLATTCACPDFAYVPVRSAAVVERLEAAGAVLIGKTNLDQFATGLVGTRTPYGIPASPFDTRYISGGSSSGSAVAVASGLVSFALGTDTAGSGRVPAAFNNLVGLKPTRGLISTRGVVPACRTLDCVSILALTSADAVRVLSVAAAFDAEDAYSREAPQSLRAAKLDGALSVGVPSHRLEFFGDNEAEALYAKSIERAARLGASIVEVDVAPFLDAAKLLYEGPWVAERLAAIKDFAARRPEAMDEVVRGIVLGSSKRSAVEAFESFYRLAELARAAEAQWRKVDALLLPTAGTTYCIADVLVDPVRLNSNLGTYTNFVNLMDLSAIAVPAGFRSNGLPFGVTLIARAFEELRMAPLADKFHRSLEDAKLGATGAALSGTEPIVAPGAPHQTIEIAVVGAHLTGQPLNWQLTDRAALLRRTARAAPGYRLYELPDSTPPKPGLVFDGEGPGGIELEVWEMDAWAFGSFVAGVPPPLCIGTVKLLDGGAVKGFLCEPHAVEGARDITSFGGWRAWLAAKTVAP